MLTNAYRSSLYDCCCKDTQPVGVGVFHLQMRRNSSHGLIPVAKWNSLIQCTLCFAYFTFRRSTWYEPKVAHDILISIHLIDAEVKSFSPVGVGPTYLARIRVLIGPRILDTMLICFKRLIDLLCLATVFGFSFFLTNIGTGFL